MAGDLLLTNLSEEELNILLECGGKLGDTIFHADKYNQAAWEAWGSRLAAGVGGSTVNNRVGLPPHFYISFSLGSYKGTGNFEFMRIIFAAIRPLTIVSAQPALANWDDNDSAFDAERQFATALKSGNLTLEVYSYEDKDLIDRGTGKVNPSLSYMELANE